MDVTHDAQFVLERAASPLISHLKALLPRFLRKTVTARDGVPTTTLRRTMKSTAVDRLTKLVREHIPCYSYYSSYAKR